MTIHDHLQTTSTAAGSWLDALMAETVTIDEAGVHAALVSIRLQGEVTQRSSARLQTLLRHQLAPTDRFEQVSESSFSVLLAPQEDLCETVNEVRDLADSIERAGIDAVTGFAQRRPREPLLDTWARAEAQLDRAAYRIEHQNGISL